MKEGKSYVDTELSTWRELLADFEQEGYTDLCINGHDVEKNGGLDAGEILN